jgi:hypothetical protein
MPTTVAAIVAWARQRLVEPTASFWTDQELTDIAALGIKDLWRGINDNYQDYFLTVDETNYSLAANTFTVTGTPADVFRVSAIEPRTLTSNIIFEHKDFTHPDFVAARAASAVSPSDGVLYWDIVGQGAPVSAPVIYVAPKLTQALLLRLVYVPTLTISTNNPIPGESDNAVLAWIVAYARSKEREDRSPDPEWLAIYNTEKANLLVALTPRQTADVEVVEAMFESLW